MFFHYECYFVLLDILLIFYLNIIFCSLVDLSFSEDETKDQMKEIATSFDSTKDEEAK